MADEKYLNTNKDLSPKDHLSWEDSESRFRFMSPEKKLELSMQLYYSARELKRSWLKLQHPDWNDAQADVKLREIFLYART